MWEIFFIRDAQEDLKRLDKSQQIQVLKAINKVAINPLPNSEGGYGKPLGNKNNSDLHGFLKIKLLKLGIRVVYNLEIKDNLMRIIIISARADNEVYCIAERRKDNIH